MAENKKETAPEVKMVRLNPVVPDDQPILFSNYATVQNDGGEVYIGFYQIRQPIILDSDDEQSRKRYDEITALDAKCIATIAMAPERVSGLIDALNSQLRKGEEKREMLSRKQNTITKRE